VQSSRTRNSIFATLTFNRDKNIRDTWLLCHVASNRFLQRVRRTVDSCEYLKVYEIHKDSYPHVHILLLFSNLNYPYNHTRWLPHDVHQKLKLAWTHGLSDYQSPLANSNYSALSYVLKYLSKSSSASHLWSRILTPDYNFTPETNENGYPLKTQKYALFKTILIPADQTLLLCNYSKKKIKLLTWSRNFVSAYLKSKEIIKPCPNAPNLH